MLAQVMVVAAVLLLLASGAPAAEDDEAEEQAKGNVASASVTVTASITGNRVEEDGASHSVKIEGSLSGNTGLVSLNQAAGSLNQQANVRVIAGGGSGDVSITTMSSAGTASLTGNTIITGEGSREAVIQGSFNNTVGVVGVNQSAGHFNQQTNVMALTIGLGEEALVLGEAELEIVTGDNEVERTGEQNRSAVIADSFDGFRGIAQVNQSAGDGNVIRQQLGISVQVLR